ncbi:signal peptidase I [Bremerella cremea]|uniref:Signal peptidase I n=1 Tax=Blastopirellula marina TaxID=124 RepID=A0A2S8FIG3_9BACT|nr:MULTISPECIES: signal peptidase I [Pirellulaceae]PQO31985.1 signal peptidase I [Blastopirellula marina]RCS45052.1 signal peptidase I [Bremerella cremea]
MVKKKRSPAAADKSGKGSKEAGDNDHFAVTREFVESLVVAVILALLFRAFEAEAFVIPTGSMATTLLGRHKDVVDQYTGYEYTVGASAELDRDTQIQERDVIQAVDPLYHRLTDVSQDTSYSGDRILVSKFAYDFSAPARWDVIVFKFPLEPQTNYIKRLIGLPGESVRIFHGDIYIKKPGENDFSIARKPPAKQLTLQRLVYDTNYPCDILEKAGFPDRLEAFPANTQGSWTKEENGSFVCKPQGETWLRYRHVLPDNGKNIGYWALAENNQPIDTKVARDRCSQLITDFSSYNTGTVVESSNYQHSSGMHWVGDLCLECTTKVESSSGVLSLDLVEGGAHFRCDIDVATGKATLSSSDASIKFDQEGVIEADTGVKGAGTYAFRFSNVDNELRLWVNDRVVNFGAPVTYSPTQDVVPKWSETDPGDLLPAGIGTSSVEMTVTRVRMYRDTYYIAFGTQYTAGRHSNTIVDYASDSHPGFNFAQESDIRAVLTDPQSWATTNVFKARREAIFDLEDRQYFPLGDNSAESSDARLWDIGQQFVPEHMLIGKALFVYWPHSKNKPIPFFPNFSRMKFIQ